MISQEGLQEFKQIIFEEQGIDLTDEEALQDATALLEAFKILAANTNLIPKDPVDTQEEACD